MISEIKTILIGFIGRVLGGIIVNTAFYKWQKKEEERKNSGTWISYWIEGNSYSR